jgi:hypothetical protein
MTDNQKKWCLTDEESTHIRTRNIDKKELVGIHIQLARYSNFDRGFNHPLVSFVKLRMNWLVYFTRSGTAILVVKRRTKNAQRHSTTSCHGSMQHQLNEAQ